MNDKEVELDRLLSFISETVDPGHCLAVDARHNRALKWLDTDRPPLVVAVKTFAKSFELPAPWIEFRGCPYHTAVDDPASMMLNMLLGRVVPGLILGDDSPLAIRADFGSIQIPAIIGAGWKILEDSYPWVEPFNSLEDLATALDDNEEIVPGKGMLPKTIEFMEYFSSKLAEHPPCDQAIQVSLPDLQGPMDWLELMGGSDIFVTLHDDPPLLNRILRQIVRATAETVRILRPYTVDRLDPSANTQHEYVVPGRLLIRNDTSIMLSPEMYTGLIRPHDAELLTAVGRGSIHFCGNGQHLIEGMIEIPDLLGLDFGDSGMMDVPAIYRHCKDRNVALTGIEQSREDLVSGVSVSSFPTGVSFLYFAENFEDAREVVSRYRRDS